jgi:hypothetical protein
MAEGLTARGIDVTQIEMLSEVAHRRPRHRNRQTRRHLRHRAGSVRPSTHWPLPSHWRGSRWRGGGRGADVASDAGVEAQPGS